MPKGSLQAEWPSLGMGASQNWRLTGLGQDTEQSWLCKYSWHCHQAPGRGRIPRAGQELKVREVAVGKVKIKAEVTFCFGKINLWM
jgi:hypothetical protein